MKLLNNKPKQTPSLQLTLHRFCAEYTNLTWTFIQTKQVSCWYMSEVCLYCWYSWLWHPAVWLAAIDVSKEYSASIHQNKWFLYILPTGTSRCKSWNTRNDFSVSCLSAMQQDRPANAECEHASLEVWDGLKQRKFDTAAGYMWSRNGTWGTLGDWRASGPQDQVCRLGEEFQLIEMFIFVN
jgi:hypothetical protein